jgi:hypothetical protein
MGDRKGRANAEGLRNRLEKQTKSQQADSLHNREAFDPAYKLGGRPDCEQRSWRAMTSVAGLESAGTSKSMILRNFFEISARRSNLAANRCGLDPRHHFGRKGSHCGKQKSRRRRTALGGSQ